MARDFRPARSCEQWLPGSPCRGGFTPPSCITPAFVAAAIRGGRFSKATFTIPPRQRVFPSIQNKKRPSSPALLGLSGGNSATPPNKLWLRPALRAATLQHGRFHVRVELRSLPAGRRADLPGCQAKRAAEIRAFHSGAVEFRVPQDCSGKRRSAQIRPAHVGFEEN